MKVRISKKTLSSTLFTPILSNRAYSHHKNYPVIKGGQEMKFEQSNPVKITLKEPEADGCCSDAQSIKTSNASEARLPSPNAGIIHNEAQLELKPSYLIAPPSFTSDPPLPLDLHIETQADEINENKIFYDKLGEYRNDPKLRDTIRQNCVVYGSNLMAGAISANICRAAIIKCIETLAPSRDVLALGTMEFHLSHIEEGKSQTVKW
jgi:hypothetical protein